MLYAEIHEIELGNPRKHHLLSDRDFEELFVAHHVRISPRPLKPYMEISLMISVLGITQNMVTGDCLVLLLVPLLLLLLLLF